MHREHRSKEGTQVFTVEILSEVFFIFNVQPLYCMTYLPVVALRLPVQEAIKRKLVFCKFLACFICIEFLRVSFIVKESGER
jgi:hypothetical protein